MDSTHDEKIRQAVQALFPEGEELVPETPTDAIGQYVLLLMQEETLAARQAAYEEELARLQAQGDALRSEWDALETEQLACVETLQTLQLPAEEIIRRTWAMIKGHQALGGQQGPRSDEALRLKRYRDALSRGADQNRIQVPADSSADLKNYQKLAQQSIEGTKGLRLP